MHARRARVGASLALLSAAAMAPLLPGVAGAAANAAAKPSALSASSSCAPGFTTMPSPTSGELLSTAAITASNVWAVGGEGHTALMLHWNGTSWTATANPAPKTSTLGGIAGSAANNVWAVGTSGVPKAYAEHWNGSAWSTKVTTAPTGSALNAVSTISSSSAWAVGYSYQAGGAGGGDTPLIEQWNGRTWTISPIALTGSLGGVVEITANDVWAVGQETFGAPGGSFTSGALVLNWNGSTWTQYAVPDSSALLRAVSANSASDVWVVGDSSTGAVTEHWTGSAWTSVPNPSLTSSSLRGVIALSQTNAWAVGDYVTAGLAQDTLAEHWNGVSWTVVPSQSVASATNELSSVTATPTSSKVWSVGLSQTAIGQGVVERSCG